MLHMQKMYVCVCAWPCTGMRWTHYFSQRVDRKHTHSHTIQLHEQGHAHKVSQTHTCTFYAYKIYTSMTIKHFYGVVFNTTNSAMRIRTHIRTHIEAAAYFFPLQSVCVCVFSG